MTDITIKHHLGKKKCETSSNKCSRLNLTYSPIRPAILCINLFKNEMSEVGMAIKSPKGNS